MNSQDANGTDSAYDEPFSHESVHEIRQRIRMMRNLVDTDGSSKKKPAPEDYEQIEDPAGKRRQSMDTGGFLSFTFGFILFLIIAVGFYAFRNLYQAVIKRFSR